MEDKQIRKADKPSRFKVKTKIILGDEMDFFGPGVSRLLHKIDECGSIASAAEEMEMSYSKAWNMLRKAEAGIGFPLILRRKGGKAGGSSMLTEEGREFVGLYDEMQKEIRFLSDGLLEKYLGKFL